MKKRNIAKAFTAVLVTAAAAFALFACDDGTQEPVKYTATYVSGATTATGTAPASVEKAEGETFTIANNTFTNEGFDFSGWSYGNTTYSAGDTFTMPASNVEFKAVWTAQGSSVTEYTVTYAKGADEATGDVPASVQKAAGAKFELPANPFTNEGFEFIGWNDGTATYTAGTEYTMPDKAVTFTAQWAQTYMVTYAKGAADATGTAPASAQKKAGDRFNLPANTFANEGYRFTGWNDGTATYQAGAQYVMPAKAVTLTAQWEESVTKYSITFFKSRDYSQTDSITGDVPVMENQLAGAMINLPAATGLSFPHYTFFKWEIYTYEADEMVPGSYDWTSQGRLDAGAQYEMPAKAVQVKGVWTANTVTINFDANGGTGTMAPNTSKKFGNTLSLTVGTAFQCKFTAPANMEFAGWALTADGEVLTTNPTLNADLLGSSDVLTLFAIWEAVPQRTEPSISFNADGGTGSAPVDITVVWDTTDYAITLPANTFTAPANKQFKGWSVSGLSTSSPADYVYKAGDKVHAAEGATVTITAVWEDVAAPAAGKTYVGNCTYTNLGKSCTYTSFSIDTDAMTVTYICTHGTLTAKLTDRSTSNWKPAGTDKYYSVYLAFGSETSTKDFYLAISADGNTLTFCDYDDNPIAGGIFTLQTSGGGTTPVMPTYNLSMGSTSVSTLQFDNETGKLVVGGTTYTGTKATSYDDDEVWDFSSSNPFGQSECTLLLYSNTLYVYGATPADTSMEDPADYSYDKA